MVWQLFVSKMNEIFLGGKKMKIINWIYHKLFCRKDHFINISEGCKNDLWECQGCGYISKMPY